MNREKNGVKERTIDAIYLRPMHSEHGGHEVMNSSMGLTLTRSRVTPVPLTQFVKNAVETLALEQGHT